MTIDLSNMVPADAVAALRSYPRRYRSELAPIDDDENVEQIAGQIGPDGSSALDIAGETLRMWIVLAEALRKIQLNESPVVHPAVIDPTQRQWDTPLDSSLSDVLDQLEEEATTLAALVESFTSTQWGRTATATGGVTVDALDVVREAVRLGRDNLDRIQQTLAALRR